MNGRRVRRAAREACVSGSFVQRRGNIQPAFDRAAGKAERLLRASVDAFCSITRPTRRETAQLDDLALPLLSAVSDDTLRFIAAALSELPAAPPQLVRRLANEPVDISAPLLMRSPILNAIDLVALIGRHGMPHARAIAARPDLDERILRLIRSIGAITDPEPAPPGKAEQVRDRLRAMMLPSGTTAARPGGLRWEGEPDVYRKLRSTALAGVPALFQTALADALATGIGCARTITEAADASRLVVALRALSLSEEEAFLILQCVWAGRPGNLRTVGAFLDAYQAVSTEQAIRMVEAWKAADHTRPTFQPASQTTHGTVLRVS